MPPVVDRAQQDIQKEELWRARERLEGYVGSSGYNREVVELLGEVCYRMGDQPAAGRYWFFTLANTPEKQAAIETFVRRHGGMAPQVWSQLPRRLRDHRPTRLPPEVRQRLENLQAAVGPRLLRRKASPKRRSNSFSDYLACGLVAVVAVFFLLCFGIGLTQLIKAM